MRAKRIANVARTTAHGGGASRVARELHELLSREIPVDVDLWVKSLCGKTNNACK